MLAVYLNSDAHVAIYGDRDGLSGLAREIQYILDHPHWDHEHFVTETGGGYGIQLSEIPLPGRRVVHYLDVALVDEDKLRRSMDESGAVD